MKFRPQSSKWSLVSSSLRRAQRWNWHERHPRTNNWSWLMNWGAHIHYLCSHAPSPVRKKWKQANIRYWTRARWWKARINDKI